MRTESTSESIFTTISKLAKKHNAINLGQGYPDFDCHKELKEHIQQGLNDGKNQYAPMMGVGELREAIAQK